MPAAPVFAPAGAPVRHPPRAVLALVCLAPLLPNADAGLVVLALPEIQRDLGMSLTGAHWVTNVYVLLVGGLQLLGGRLCDRRSPRHLFLGSLAAFAAASAVCGAAPVGEVLLAARAAQAVAAGLLVPAAMCMLLTVTSGAEQRRRALALWAACGGMGSIGGVLVGGLTVSQLDWRWAFFLNVPVALAACVAGRRLCPRYTRESPGGLPVDLPGALFLVGALLAFVYALVGTADRGLSGVTWGAFGAAGVLAALFLRRQKVAADPLLPAVLWRDRTLVAGALGILFVAAATGPVVFVASPYLQEVHGYSAWAAGCALLPVVGGVLVVGPLCARLLGRFGPRLPAPTGCALSGAGLLLLTRVLPDSPYVAGLLPGLTLVGAGLPFLWMAYETAAVSEVRAGSLGAAAGVVQCAGQIGAAIGLALVVTVYRGAAQGPSGQGGAGTAGLALPAEGAARAFWVCAVLMACVALTAWFELRAASARGGQALGAATCAPSRTGRAPADQSALSVR
ncbi:MFS transporter [Microtetraspora malaysiensis]|uniref:MFS transporter n=1 Tax=Microtetraspora malaysiensis TaxID=161358 RepID=UPI003D927C73